jgi:hypothetical protein
VAHMGDRKGAYTVSVGTCDRKRPHGKPKNKWIILKLIFKKWDGEAWTGLIRLRLWQ